MEWNGQPMVIDPNYYAYTQYWSAIVWVLRAGIQLFFQRNNISKFFQHKSMQLHWENESTTISTDFWEQMIFNQNWMIVDGAGQRYMA